MCDALSAHVCLYAVCVVDYHHHHHAYIGSEGREDNEDDEEGWSRRLPGRRMTPRSAQSSPAAVRRTQRIAAGRSPLLGRAVAAIRTVAATTMTPPPSPRERAGDFEPLTRGEHAAKKAKQKKNE